MSEKRTRNLVANLDAVSVFPRVFRFTCVSKKNPHLEMFTHKVHYSLKKKTLTVEAYEAILAEDPSLNPTLDYVQHMLGDVTDEFVLTTFDGVGLTAAEHVFSNAKLVDHNTDFSYADSDIVSHSIVFKYDDCRIANKYHLPSEPIPMGAKPRQKAESK